jgi:hypothetical protein
VANHADAGVIDDARDASRRSATPTLWKATTSPQHGWTTAARDASNASSPTRRARATAQLGLMRQQRNEVTNDRNADGGGEDC